MPQARRGRPAVLIDSNIFIAVEDHGADGHVHGPLAAELLRRVQEVGYNLLLSHGTRTDLLSAPGPLRSRRQRALSRYVVMEPIQHHDEALRAEFPSGALSTNDAADLEVLESFSTGRAQWLVTQDGRMRRRAAAARMRGVLSLGEAVEMFRALTGAPIPTVPAVSQVKGYTLNLRAPIFESLRADYANFDAWWHDKVAAEDRDAIVLGDTAEPDGVAVLKVEFDRPHGLPSPVLKICTFKVDTEYQGAKRGEALLKACVEYARQAGTDCAYVEVLPEKFDLLTWLGRFGFAQVPGAAPTRGQVVLRKLLDPPAGAAPLPPLDHAIAYGPGSLRIERAHIVPIQNTWHHLLFPDADSQGDLLAGNDGCGNAIRKAYLCHANSRKVRPGDTLLFVHTGVGATRITTAGTVEDTRVSRSVEDLVKFVGTRTVYRSDQIAAQCESGEVLALLFRHDRALAEPVPITALVEAGVLGGVPQSITELNEEAVAWVRHRVGV